MPPALVGPVILEKLLTSRGAPALDQLALAALLLESGRYDQHVGGCGRSTAVACAVSGQGQ